MTIRSTISIAITAFVLTAASGCKLFDELRTFSMDFNSSFTIPGNSLVSIPIDIPTPPITTNSQETFDTEGIATEWIDEIKLTHVTLTITSPSGETFSFLQSVHSYINASGQTETLLASKDPVPETIGNTMALDVTGTDLKAFVSQSEFSLNTVVTTDESQVQEVEVDIAMTFEVKATIPG